MRNAMRWVRTALLTVAQELLPGRLPPIQPLPKALLVIAAGLAFAFALPVDARPAGLTSELAVQRLQRFLSAKMPEPPPGTIPAGTILTPRPAFHWPAAEGAARYDFQLEGEIRRSGLETPRFLMSNPGRLERGRRYRYVVTAYDDRGRGLGLPIRGEFTVGDAPETLLDLEAKVRLDLEPGEAALVLAGYYAQDGSPSDVAAALEAYLEAAPQGDAVPLAVRVLKKLGCR